MTAERRIALVRDHDALLEIVRAVVARRGMSCNVIDELAGYHSGYAGKLLSQIKSLGPMSMGPMLQVLGLGLVVVELPEEIERMAKRYTRRDEKRVRSGVVHAKASIGLKKLIEAEVVQRMAQRNARKGGYARAGKLSGKRRRWIARRAARARWRKVKRQANHGATQEAAILE